MTSCLMRRKPWFWIPLETKKVWEDIGVWEVAPPQIFNPVTVVSQVTTIILHACATQCAFSAV